MRNFLGAIVEQHAVQGIARILRANQMRKRQRHALGGREAVLAVKNHAVAAIEHQHRRARTLILALVDHQIRIIEFDRKRRAVALHRVEERPADVHIQRVAEFVWLRAAARFHAGGQVARVVPAEAALAERGQQVLQRLEAQKIERLVGDFKTRLDIRLVPADLPAGRLGRRRSHARRLLLRDQSLLPPCAG